jgi:hypothetical protein
LKRRIEGGNVSKYTDGAGTEGRVVREKIHDHRQRTIRKNELTGSELAKFITASSKCILCSD